MKTHIIIHVLPFEIDRFEHQMFELRKNGKYLDTDDEVVIDATLNVNDLLVDWSKSKISKDYFVDRFNDLKKIADWTIHHFDVDSEGKCLGVDDKRRNSIRKYHEECDNFIYLDNDMFYPNTTLKYIMDAAKLVKNKFYIISPQLPKLWEPSWDVLVNDAYINLKFEDSTCERYTTDQFDIYTKDFGEIEIKPIPTFKMGGGWFNMLSANLLAYTDIPDSFGPYGLDDTFVIDACGIMKSLNVDVQQYVMKNLVVTQSYMFELHRMYLNHISFNINKKQEFAANAAKYYNQEIQKFIERCKNDFIHNPNKK